MKLRKRFIIIFSILGLMGLLGGCHMFEKPSLTKEQQDNVVKRIARGYEIESIEFTGFSRDKKTRTYLLNIKINNDNKLETTIPFRNLERLNNDSDEIGLNPVDDFETIQRSQVLEKVDIANIDISYLGE